MEYSRKVDINFKSIGSFKNKGTQGTFSLQFKPLQGKTISTLLKNR